MTAIRHTLAMIAWWAAAGVHRADLALRRATGSMIWHPDQQLERLPLPWASAENVRQAEVYIRPARGYAWPVVFLDDVSTNRATAIAKKQPFPKSLPTEAISGMVGGARRADFDRGRLSCVARLRPLSRRVGPICRTAVARREERF